MYAYKVVWHVTIFMHPAYCMTPRIFLHSLEKESYEVQQEEARLLLCKKLPRYAANCFVASGYDTIYSIAAMDMSEGPENSLNAIETFINKKFPNCRKFIFSESESSVEFPPGHVASIKKFVDEVKQLDEERCSVARKKRAATIQLRPSKGKVRLSQAISEPPSDSIASSASRITAHESVTATRQQIIKWQRRSKCKKVRELKEHKHYELNIRMASESFNIVVLCKLCGKNKALSKGKYSKPVISNWTQHIIKCVESEAWGKHEAGDGKTLKKFFTSTADPSNSSDSANLCSGNDSAGIQLTSFELASANDQQHHFRLSPPFWEGSTQ